MSRFICWGYQCVLWMFHRMPISRAVIDGHLLPVLLQLCVDVCLCHTARVRPHVIFALSVTTTLKGSWQGLDLQSITARRGRPSPPGHQRARGLYRPARSDCACACAAPASRTPPPPHPPPHCCVAPPRLAPQRSASVAPSGCLLTSGNAAVADVRVVAMGSWGASAASVGAEKLP